MMYRKALDVLLLYFQERGSEANYNINSDKNQKNINGKMVAPKFCLATQRRVEHLATFYISLHNIDRSRDVN